MSAFAAMLDDIRRDLSEDEIIEDEKEEHGKRDLSEDDTKKEII